MCVFPGPKNPRSSLLISKKFAVIHEKGYTSPDFFGILRNSDPLTRILF